MIKVENDMLVLDSTFSKDDVKAIDEFVKINVDRERERIIKILNDTANDYLSDKLLVEAAIIINAIAYIKNFGE